MCWLTIGILLTIVFLLTLASLWLVRGLGVYTKVFADEHFREVAARLPALKRAALERVVSSESDAVCTSEDPRGMLTSVGLAVLYLVGRQGPWFHHDLSVSLPIRAYTAHAIGDVFICFLAQLLGIGRERLSLRVSSKTVHHAEFTLSRLEHQQFTDRPVLSLSSEELAAFRRHWALSWRRGDGSVFGDTHWTGQFAAVGKARCPVRGKQVERAERTSPCSTICESAIT